MSSEVLVGVANSINALELLVRSHPKRDQRSLLEEAEQLWTETTARLRAQDPLKDDSNHRLMLAAIRRLREQLTC